MSANEGTWDRVLRLAAGLILLAAAYFGLEGTAAWVAGLIGVIALATGAIGWCPAYAIFGFDTCPLKDRPAPRT